MNIGKTLFTRVMESSLEASLRAYLTYRFKLVGQGLGKHLASMLSHGVKLNVGPFFFNKVELGAVACQNGRCVYNIYGHPIVVVVRKPF